MRYQANDARVAWRVVEGEGVLLHAETSGYYGLNRTGTLLWQQLVARPSSVEELGAWVEEHLSGAPEDPAVEVAAFIAQLLQYDLIDAAVPGAEQLASGQPDAGLNGNGAEYEPPLVSPFGELEKLILSGE
ncbi:MAG TPA: PqqD family protein [Gemmatimonadales bacterium]